MVVCLSKGGVSSFHTHPSRAPAHEQLAGHLMSEYHILFCVLDTPISDMMACQNSSLLTPPDKLILFSLLLAI